MECSVEVNACIMLDWVDAADEAQAVPTNTNDKFLYMVVEEVPGSQNERIKTEEMSPEKNVEQ